MANAASASASRPQHKVPDDLLSVLRQVQFGVGNDNIKKSNAVMNQVTLQIVRSLQKEHSLVVKPEFVGSSFEGTKIEAADEFDVLIILDGSQLRQEQLHPQFFALRPKTRDDPTFREFLTSSGLIDPKKVIARMQSWVRLEINKLFPPGSRGDFMVGMTQSGPATTLTIQASPTSSKYKGIGEICVDLVPAFQVMPDQFVAKPCKRRLVSKRGAPIRDQEFLWRKSMSLLEKKALEKIDEDGGCRRQCIKILKYMRLRDAPLKYLASYHYKVLVLNECSKYRKPEDWKPDRLAERLWGLLGSLMRHLEEKRLPHNLNPKIDIFETISDETALGNTMHRVEGIMKKDSTVIKSILGQRPLP